MVKYVKCPRCELNYIDPEKAEYCDICLKEMKGIDLYLDDIDVEDGEEELTEICPICGENMMHAGEKMCDECKLKAMEETEEPDPDREDDEWRNYIDDDTDVELDSETAGIDETFDEEYEEEPDEEYEGEDDEDDFEYVTGDDIYKLDDDEDDEDEEDPDDDF